MITTEYFRVRRHPDPRKLIETEGDFQATIAVLSQQLSTGAVTFAEFSKEREKLRLKLRLNADEQCDTEIASFKNGKGKASPAEVKLDTTPFGLDYVLSILGCKDTRKMMMCGKNVAVTIPEWGQCLANANETVEKLTDETEKGKMIIPIPFRVEWNGDPEDLAPATSMEVIKALPKIDGDKKMPQLGKFGIRFPDRGTWRPIGMVSGDVVDVLSDDSAPRAFIVCEVDLKPYLSHAEWFRSIVQSAAELPATDRSKLIARWEQDKPAIQTI